MPIFQLNNIAINTIASRSSYSSNLGMISVQRQPNDPLFFSNIILQNVIVGSRYRIAAVDNLSITLAEGVADATTISINSIPAFSNPALFEVRLRNASGFPVYLTYRTYGYLAPNGATVYCSQVEDKIAELA